MENEDDGTERLFDPASGQWLEPDELHAEHARRSAAAADPERFGGIEASQDARSIMSSDNSLDSVDPKARKRRGLRSRQGARRTLNAINAAADDPAAQYPDGESDLASNLNETGKIRKLDDGALSAGDEETEIERDPFEAFLEHPRRQFSIYGSKVRASSGDNFTTNYVQTAKYNFFTFLPLNLFVQLSKAANIYFLALTALQLVPQITITNGQPTNLSGLVPVILISMIKDLLEDLKRRAEDDVENN